MIPLEWEADVAEPADSNCETACHIRNCNYCRAIIQIVLKERLDALCGFDNCLREPGGL